MQQETSNVLISLAGWSNQRAHSIQTESAGQSASQNFSE